MDNSAGFDTSFHGCDPGRCYQHGSKLFPLESSLVPDGFSDSSQLAAKDLLNPNTSHPGPIPFEAACPPVSPDGPSTFEGEFHVTECEQPSSSYSARHRDSVSSSESSLSDPASPVALYPPIMGALGKARSDEEEGLWNLVAYHIPWGSTYEGYAAGTLPGPEGPCLFLRSPTPSKKQRTSQACEKCRERKAKCSGTRPSCARCDARGHTCIYTPVHIPSSHPRTSNTSSPPRPPRSPSLTHSENIRLAGTYAISFSRKGSLTESELSLSSDSSEDSTEVCVRRYGNVHHSPFALDHWSPQHPLYVSPESAVPLPDHPPITVPTTPSYETQTHMFPLQLRGSTHALYRSAVPHPTNSPSGLDDYRFPPPLEASKSVELVHPKPQLLGGGPISALSNSISQSGTVFENFGTIGVGVPGVWEAGLPRNAYEIGIEPSGTDSGQSQPTSCYAGASHHNEPQSTFSIPSNGGFFDPAYAAFEWSDPYNSRGAYNF